MKTMKSPEGIILGNFDAEDGLQDLVRARRA